MLKILKFFSLSTAEQRIFLWALWLLVYFRVSLKFRDLKVIFQKIEDAHVELVANTTLSPRRIGQLIDLASHYIPYSTCFSRTLAGRMIFSKYGYISTVHIGVANDGTNGFSAHAWLTCSGEIVLCNLPDIGKYREMPLEKLRIFN